ncbi:hypothetical protein B0J17DRAFT_220134 [Rhizoctonia solani]|nr:hypothetical protein B0J17DRAFT_220134 [Rhizoctonia solani]
MLEIFMGVIFDRNGRKSLNPPSFKRGARMVYRRLYNLLGVCSVWKDFISARKDLWSVIPIIEGRSDKKHNAIQNIMQNAGGSPLHLAISLTRSASSRLINMLTGYAPRLRAINLGASSRYVMRDIIHRLLQHGTPRSLSELSIQFDNTNSVNKIPKESDYIVPSVPAFIGTPFPPLLVLSSCVPRS